MPLASSSAQRSAEHLVVGGLAGEVVVGQRDAQRRVDLVEVDLRQVDELTPQGQGVGVAGLELDDPGAGPHVEVALAAGRLGLVGAVELDPGRLVEGVGVGDEQVGLLGVPTDVEQVLDEHAEGCAPVTDVVLPDDVVAEVLEGAGQRVADDGRAQVPDVHLLGDVGRGVVDRDVLCGLQHHTVALVGLDVLQQPGDPRAREGEVDEAGAAHLDGVAHAVEVEGVDDPGRDLARRQADLLGEGERGVDLHVGELRRAQHRVGLAVVVTEGGGDRGLDLGRERDERGNHAGKSICADRVPAPPFRVGPTEGVCRVARTAKRRGPVVGAARTRSWPRAQRGARGHGREGPSGSGHSPWRRKPARRAASSL